MEKIIKLETVGGKRFNVTYFSDKLRRRVASFGTQQGEFTAVESIATALLRDNPKKVKLAGDKDPEPVKPVAVTEEVEEVTEDASVEDFVLNTLPDIDLDSKSTPELIDIVHKLGVNTRLQTPAKLINLINASAEDIIKKMDE